MILSTGTGSSCKDNVSRLDGNSPRYNSTYKTVDTSVDDGDLDLHRQRLVLPLLCITRQSLFASNPLEGLTEQLSQTGTTREQEASRRIKIRTELRESSDFTVLCKVELERTRELLHDLGLRRRTDTGHGETDVDGGPDTTEEQLSLQEDLAVGDRDNLRPRCQ